MSASTNPNLYSDDVFVSEANFKQEINQKMKVPEKISFDPDKNNLDDGWNKDNINMQVPERIIILGNEKHIGTRAPPREMVLDNSILPTNPYLTDIRVATPPRTLTLDKYPFPDFDEQEIEDEESIVKLNNTILNDSKIFQDTSRFINGTGDGLTPAAEVLHLRKQVAKLNRRVMTLEMDNINRLQKEKFILGFGVAYVLLKIIVWMSRD